MIPNKDKLTGCLLFSIKRLPGHLPRSSCGSDLRQHRVLCSNSSHISSLIHKDSPQTTRLCKPCLMSSSPALGSWGLVSWGCTPGGTKPSGLALMPLLKHPLSFCSGSDRMVVTHSSPDALPALRWQHEDCLLTKTLYPKHDVGNLLHVSSQLSQHPKAHLGRWVANEQSRFRLLRKTTWEKLGTKSLKLLLV